MAAETYVCDACFEQIPNADLKNGSAREIEGEIYCAECVSLVAPDAIDDDPEMLADIGGDPVMLEDAFEGVNADEATVEIPVQKKGARRARGRGRKRGGRTAGATAPGRKPAPARRSPNTPAPARGGRKRSTRESGSGSRRGNESRRSSARSQRDDGRTSARSSRDKDSRRSSGGRSQRTAAAATKANPMIFVGVGVGVVAVLLLLLAMFSSGEKGRRNQNRAGNAAASEEQDGDQGSVEANRRQYWKNKTTVIDVKGGNY